MSSTSTSTDVITNLTHLLPTGTFLAFQSLAPLFTNNGACGTTEKIVTGILLGIFFLLCFGLSFTDSVTTDTGKVYYGIVTKKGLYNKQFKTLVIPGDLYTKDSFFTGGKDHIFQYTASFADFMNGVLNVISFAALSCLTPPITTCYYPRLSSTVVKTGPVLAALIVGALFAVFPTARHGIGYSLTTSGVGPIHVDEPPAPAVNAGDSVGTGTGKQADANSTVAPGVAPPQPTNGSGSVNV